MSDGCSVEGCENTHLARGLCSPHYHKDRKERRKQLPCSIEGCNGHLHQADLCHSHYWRKYAHGDPLAGGTPLGEPLQWLRETVTRCLRDQVTDCVEQTYQDSETGYAGITFEGKTQRMHVISVILSGRDAPQRGQVTRHMCSNGKCVNPLHLVVGTQKENVADAIAAGTWGNRYYRGASVSSSKLTEDTVLAIRASSEKTIVLARRFGVRAGTIRDIQNRRTWKHLP